MAKRNTVNVNVVNILKLTAENGWSAATLSKRVGKHERWISEVKRGKNLPSPEEAAKMCLLLNTAPEGILVEPADIELVKGLIEQEREEQDIKKDLPSREVSELTDIQKEAWELIKKWDDEKLKRFIAAAKAMLGE